MNFVNAEILWLDGLGIGIVSFWIYLLIRRYVTVFYVSKPKSWMRDALIFISLFGVRFLFLLTEHNIIPLLGILLVLVPNTLFIYLLGKGSKMLILAGATLFSAVEVSMDVLVFFGLNLILPEQYILDAYFFVFVILVYPLAYLLLGVGLKHDEEKIRRNRKKLQLIMLFGIVFVRIVANIFIMYTPEILWGREISNDVFIALMILLFVAILGENEVSKMSYQKQIKDIEYNALKRHMEDIEQQTLEIQKFKHDYRNILMSLEWYILKSESHDLIDYFNTRIKQISQSWDQEDCILNALDRINEKEVRSILKMKIQRMLSLEIRVELEQIDEINTINIDPIIMVRTIGIILDNAIEEVEHLEQGVIKIGFIKEENGIVFSVSNNCRENHCSIEDINRKTFTTKGEGRGIGLQILEDFSVMHNNFCVETEIDDNWFTQVVTVTG